MMGATLSDRHNDGKENTDGSGIDSLVDGRSALHCSPALVFLLLICRRRSGIPCNGHSLLPAKGAFPLAVVQTKSGAARAPPASSRAPPTSAASS